MPNITRNDRGGGPSSRSEKNAPLPILLPEEIPPLLLDWYDENARDLPWRRNRDPYAVWVSEIMLQQTRVEAVREKYLRFLGEFPDVAALAAADDARLYKLWEGLGYYSRAHNLRAAARLVVREHGGAFPRAYDEILRLPGVGPYTAGAVASICFEAATPAVDGNVIRVVSRLAALPDDMGSQAAKRRVAEALAHIYPAERRGDFTQSLMELGATVCVPNGPPRCGVCPLARHCAAHRAGNPEDYPSLPPKRPREIRELTVFLLFREERIAIRRRPESGLLAGLWELPNVEGKLEAAAAERLLAEWGLSPGAIEALPPQKHVFTHVEWHLLRYRTTCGTHGEGLVWADAGEIEERHALPTAFRKCL
jgi:A/G-specific adenine glycosylase